MKTNSLPLLPYAYNALEPFIDSKTMEIHHLKHHQAYIDNLNQALSGTSYESMYLEELLWIVKGLPASIRNNAGGHYNHSFFWSVISPPTLIDNTEEEVKNLNELQYVILPQQKYADRAPDGDLAVAIIKDFGSFENFKIEFAEAAMARFGLGWAWLIWSEDEHKLKITTTPFQDNPLMQLEEVVTGTPIIGLDVWEHAFYLQYQNRRAEYVAGFWKIINWDTANKHYLMRK